ncbi:adenylate/guanylate cyclase domain-containing protein [Thalassospira mesophila]|uniref:Guanylate cyclase domain-containing protein n=1 Tax=Thalassospira mesophila TaxID=1293891 RepID=A0A1Y2L1B0_9PROT|nr:adenylate/guanylate cyclase domain-containing protein [Thalassospira mesophila]OSQ38249.1 hypothetical protein TMES_10140 [Thalassospira mesophila]
MSQVIARKQVSYEVYIKDRTGKWIIHAHYTGAQKKVAEDETYQLEREAHVMAVKLIREVYSSATNSADEYIVYQTRDAEARPKIAATRAPTAPGQGSETSTTDPSANAGSPTASPSAHPKNAKTLRKKDTGMFGLILKMMLAFCGAIAIGLATMLGAARLLEFLAESGYQMSQGAFEKSNFIAFILGFILSIAPMMMALSQRFSQFGSKRNTDDPASPLAPALPNGPTDEQMRTARAAALRRSLEENRAFLTDQESGDPVSASGPSPGTSPGTSPGPDSRDANMLDDASGPTDLTAPDDSHIEAGQDKTPALQATRQMMKDFMAGSVRAIHDALPQLDAYHKFGMNLYVAGACDACSEYNALPGENGRSVLRDCISALGANGTMSDTFCASLDQYLLEPKYNDMYGSGRDSMMDFVKDESSITGSVARALHIWSEKPVSATRAQAGKNVHALMFTDIVSSTRLTQELGDIGAQQIVHAHNKIVRTALLNNYGKEVKHMGDGIMAVFPSSNSAVEGAIEIQKQMAAYNARDDLEFHVRIGINAGEAISEENDLFGTVVQLAARVCAAASGDETLVSMAVKETYAGKRAAFTSRGVRDMKGFDAPVEVFAVTSRQ